MRAAVLMAGVGGLLPTLARLAASFASDPNQPLPQWHILIALAIFFVLGCVIDLATNREADLRRAVLIGIAAPGLITNIVAGSVSGTNPAATLSPEPTTSVALPAPPPIRPPIVGPATVGPATVGPAAVPGTAPARRLVVRVAVDGAPASALAVAISAAAGQPSRSVPLGAARAGADVRLTLPADATSITATDAGHTATVPLPPTGDIAIQVSVQIGATGQGDFLWGLGVPRAAEVTALGLKLANLPD